MKNIYTFENFFTNLFRKKDNKINLEDGQYKLTNFVYNRLIDNKLELYSNRNFVLGEYEYDDIENIDEFSNYDKEIIWDFYKKLKRWTLYSSTYYIFDYNQFEKLNSLSIILTNHNSEIYIYKTHDEYYYVISRLLISKANDKYYLCDQLSGLISLLKKLI